ncbi:ATP-binding cassette domain-containing protein [Brachybacterium sp. GU-2]|uniref:ATP-binding cassette domain-containing protein n=1 Tax=Brachybacterium sp. GU-2 TaxID=3069708 RepID=UPI00298D5E5B|nr:ATP-binding cassette domain-containing protein [Brachybacterium sp. GU-2]WNN96440.1 ATP-binding cassette domain-containing protein [Brachybacterium sp. GU-2]
MTAHATPEQPGPEPADAPDPPGPAAGTVSERPSHPVWSAAEAEDAWAVQGVDDPSGERPDGGSSAEEWLQGPVESRAGHEPLPQHPAVGAEPPTDELPVTDPSPAEPVLAHPSVAIAADGPAPAEQAPAELSADEAFVDAPTAPEADPDRDPESGEHWHVVDQPLGADPQTAASQDSAPQVGAAQVAAASSDVPPVTGAPLGTAGADLQRAASENDSAAGSTRAPHRPPHGPSQPGAAAARHDEAQPAPQRPTEPAPEPASESAPTPPARPGGTLAATLELLAPHLRPQRPALATGGITLVLGTIALALSPLALRSGLDAASSTGAASALPAAFGLAAAALIGVGLRALASTSLDGAGSRAATGLRSRLLHHLHRLSPGRDIEDLEGAATPLLEDVASLRDLVGRAGPRLLGAVIALVTLLITVLVIAPTLAPVPILAAVLAALVSILTGRSGARRETAARTDAAALADTAQELLAATRTVQSYGLEDRAAGTLAEVGARAARSRSAARRGRVLGLAAHALIGAAGAVAVLLLGGGESAGDLVVVLAATLAAVPLAGAIVRSRVEIAAAVAAASGLSDLLSRTAAIGEPPRTLGVGRLRGEVVFSAITAHAERGPRFDGISVVIPAGQRVALMDRSGAEASALLSYLLRFDQPETGRVLLDRYDTRSLSLADLRGALAVVQREPALFSETVRENIRAGRPEADDLEVAEAARRSGADVLHSELPNGYETLLVRRGAALTDGRRRRIAIARALLRDAPVVLLDRADAELAPRERAEVLAALDALGEGRTVLIHSRDPETVRGADRVLWFEDGRLVEDGHPDRLADDPDSRLATWLLEADDPEA